MRILADNRKAFFDYTISEELIAGLVLSGAEVKSVKASAVSLKGAYISVRNTAKGPEAFLVKAHITAYKYAGSKETVDTERERKLLLKKSELSSLIGKEKGSILIPLELIQTGRGLVKVKIGIGKSKKKYDKRESIKKREADIRIRRMEH